MHPADPEAHEEGFDPSKVTIQYGTDATVRIACPSCHAEQTLTECTLTRERNDTVYCCRHGCQRLVVVGPAEGDWQHEIGVPWDESIVRSSAEMHIPVHSKEAGELAGTLSMFASPKALMKREFVEESVRKCVRHTE